MKAPNSSWLAIACELASLASASLACELASFLTLHASHPTHMVLAGLTQVLCVFGREEGRERLLLPFIQ